MNKVSHDFNQQSTFLFEKVYLRVSKTLLFQRSVSLTSKLFRVKKKLFLAENPKLTINFCKSLTKHSGFFFFFKLGRKMFLKVFFSFIFSNKFFFFSRVAISQGSRINKYNFPQFDEMHLQSQKSEW